MSRTCENTNMTRPFSFSFLKSHKKFHQPQQATSGATALLSEYQSEFTFPLDFRPEQEIRVRYRRCFEHMR
jgi:hypothetical protein